VISATIPIETPEGISLTYELAGLSDRGMAYLVDLLIRCAALAVIGALFFLFLGEARLAGVGLWLVVYFLVEWGYFVLFELLWDGQSPGKRLFELRVIKSAGHPVGFYDSALRNLLRGADIMPMTYAVGAVCILASGRFQRLGDLAAGTIVVRERKAGLAVRPVKTDREMAQAELRGVSLSHRERHLLAEFLHRKDRLHPDRREELAEILAVAYSRRYNLPGEEQPSVLLAKLHASTLGDSREEKP
jgi:uncharacterized RDD family membrane protein YckC